MSAVARFNAWFFDSLDGYINHVGREHKQSAFGGLSARRVVEIGAGSGANVGHLQPGTELVAIEPNVHMHDRLARRCEAAGVELTILAGTAERIELPDASVDEVIGSLVLCTVVDPSVVLAEVRRILRPGGRFRFVEHVAAPERGVRRAVQRILRRPWGWVFEGCDPGRHTAAAIERAGFAAVRVEHRKFRQSLFWPVNTGIWGTAVR